MFRGMIIENGVEGGWKVRYPLNFRWLTRNTCGSNWKKRERRSFELGSSNLLSLSTNEIRPSSLNRARTHEPGTREIADAPRSPRSFSLSLCFFLLSLSFPRDRFHGEHFQLSIVRTFLDTPFGIHRSVTFASGRSPLSAASPTDSRCLPRQRDWNLFIALADRHSRSLIGGSNRGEGTVEQHGGRVTQGGARKLCL